MEERARRFGAAHPWLEFVFHDLPIAVLGFLLGFGIRSLLP